MKSIYLQKETKTTTLSKFDINILQNIKKKFYIFGHVSILMFIVYHKIAHKEVKCLQFSWCQNEYFYISTHAISIINFLYTHWLSSMIYWQIIQFVVVVVYFILKAKFIFAIRNTICTKARTQIPKWHTFDKTKNNNRKLLCFPVSLFLSLYYTQFYDFSTNCHFIYNNTRSPTTFPANFSFSFAQ